LKQKHNLNFPFGGGKKEFNKLFIPDDLKRVVCTQPRKLLILLLLTDLVLIVMNVLLCLTSITSDPWFNLNKERGFSESYQYIKEFWIVILLLYLGIKKHGFVLYGWALLFLYILFDNALAIHGKFGEYLINVFAVKNVLGTQTDGMEVLVVASLICIGALFVIGISYLFSNKRMRAISNTLIFFVLIFGFFGVIMNFIHDSLGKTSFNLALIIMEEGGEMLTMSFILWYVFNIKPLEDL